ncbi:DUF4349 domain-containing protein [Hymenobacter swuensis]|uniref:DUF4349 domain-containing protein n=1 Tax=Hymenobacter swuensis DY53 TaxID=1227739 RepID=W8F2F6_9BACT|nr:DUF4349 domain-containing protein [Hymenobacter swuensis]AHJ98207.1 hypothetical protein Hsw_2612 [Hymenobacter swuensis DY53]
MRITHFFPLLALTGLLACSQSEPAGQDRVESAAEELTVSNYEAAPPPPPEAPGPDDASAATNNSESVQPAASRKLVYHAKVRMKVVDVPGTNARMDSLTRATGAYVEEVSETRADDEWRHYMKIRVVPGRFQGLLRGLGRLGTVESQEMTTEDVTAQHADVSARLRSKRALEQRYLALLGRASKVSDLLEIEEGMGKIREDIEATESRLRTLNHEVGFSTITLTYYQPLTRPTPDQPVLSFGSRLVESFYSGWQWFIDLLLGLIAAWPLGLLLVTAAVLLRRWRRRRARTR